MNANTPATAAAIIRIRSSELIVGTAAEAARGTCGAAGAAARGGVAGAAVARGTACVGAEVACVALAPVGPPGGSVGNLIVGAADGLGGKLMRTVSFLG